MDPLPLQDLYSNILATGLWEVIIARPLSRQRSPRRALSQQLVDRIKERTAELIDEPAMGSFRDAESREAFVRLLGRPELPPLIGHLFLTVDSSRGISAQVDDPPAVATLAALWADESGRDLRRARTEIGHLYVALEQTATDLLRDALGAGELEALSLAIAREVGLVEEQLEGLNRQLSLIRDPDLDQRRVRKMTERLRDEIGQRYAQIDLADVHDRARVSLNDIYVEPALSVGVERTPDDDRWSLAEALSSAPRIVIVGHPGAGKTTALHRICSNLGSLVSQGATAVPFFVPLRTFVPSGFSLVEFLERQAVKDYELPDVPANGIEYLLTSGQALLLLDGLDEILDGDGRRQTRDRVESIVRQYPRCRVVVTSRIVGYWEAPLDARLFAHVRVSDFDEPRVETYASKWFRLIEDQAATADEKTRAFLKESRELEDLRSTPLLLALLCALFREEHTIPRYRAEVYERCARLLFDRWDARRAIRPKLPAQEYVREFIQHLARWFLEEPARRDGVPRPELEEEAVTFLSEKIYDDRTRAREPAHEFVEFLSGRAWVLSGIGGRGKDELFRFTHNSFLEYFAAEQLLSDFEDSEVLAREMLQRERDETQHLVSQLALQLKARRQSGASDEILRVMIEESRREKGANILAFAFRVLPGLRPTPVVSRALVAAAVENFCVSEDPIDPIDAVDQLSFAREEIQEIVAPGLAGSLGHHLRANDRERAMRALEVMTWLMAKQGRSRHLREQAMRVVEESSVVVRDLFLDSLPAAQQLTFGGVRSIAALIEHHGLEGLLRGAPLPVSQRLLRPLGLMLVSNRIFAGRTAIWGDGQRKIADAILQVDPPEEIAGLKRWGMAIPEPADGQNKELASTDEADLFVSVYLIGLVLDLLAGHVARVRLQEALRARDGDIAQLSAALVEARLAVGAAAPKAKASFREVLETTSVSEAYYERLLRLGF